MLLDFDPAVSRMSSLRLPAQPRRQQLRCRRARMKLVRSATQPEARESVLLVTGSFSGAEGVGCGARFNGGRRGFDD